MGTPQPAAGVVATAGAARLPLVVLLLEDREADAELMLHELRRGGFAPQAMRVSTEAEFISALVASFDVILADYALPQFDAVRALDLLLARGCDTPVIIVSGALSDEEALACIAQGAADYLLKDRLGRLPFAVRRVLADRQARQRLDEHRTLLVREQAARALVEADRAHLRALLEQAPAVICLLTGPKHIYSLANSHYRRLVGERDLLGKPIREAIPELEGQGIYELLDQVFSSGEPYVGQEVPVTLDRGQAGPEQGWFNFVYAPLRDADGEVDGIFVHAVDVSTQVLARLQIAAQRDQLQQVIDALPEGVAIADWRGLIVQSNAAARAIWGQPPPTVDAHGYTAFGVRHIDGSPYASEEMPLARSVLAGEVVQGEQLLVQNLATQDWTPVLANSAPLHDATGAIAGGVVVFQDISALKALDRQKDAFLAQASHDLKNPLSAVRVQAQLLQRQLASGRVEPERWQQSLQRIEETTRRATTLVEQLLDVTRRQMGLELELQRSEVNLVALVQRIVEEHRAIAERHNFRVEAAEPSVVGDWDAVRLDRVLNNLVANAVKYSPDGGTIGVAIARTPGVAVLTVTDQGIGIPPDQLPHVFDRFFRARNVGAIEGSGIGLDSVRHIVEAHRGHISLDSQEGRGTTVRVELPLTVPERLDAQSAVD